MRGWLVLGFGAMTLLALAGCATSGQPAHDTAEQENRHQLCQSWVGDPNDEKCLSTFRRILP